MAEQPERIECVDPSPSLDDWMIINKSENNENEHEKVVVIGKNHQNEQMKATEVAEIAEEEIVNETLSDDVETRSVEDSDISVLETDYESAIVERRVSNALDKRDIIQYFEKISIIYQSGFIKNVIIVCLLAVILAMYADRSSKIENHCMFTNGVDIRLENKMLMDHLKDLNKVLTQMKPYISKWNTIHNRSKEIKENPSAHQKFIKHAHFNNNHVPEFLLQSSLNSLCSIINGVQSVNQPVISNICESRGVIFNLIEFKNVVNSSLREFQQINNPTINKYLQETDQKLSRLCQSLMDDLSVAVDRLILKVYNKLNKANNKLNKWVCAVKNNKILYDAFLMTFDKNNVTLEGCGENVNSTSFEFKKPKKNIEDGNFSSNVTFDFWRKDRFKKHRERKFDKKNEEKKCDKRKRSNANHDEPCQDIKSQETFGPFDSDKGMIFNSPWNAVKSTYKTRKAKKPHKMKVKSNNKKSRPPLTQSDALEVIEGQEDEAINSNERKEAKNRKFSKKGKKCSNKKCKKAIKYTNKTRTIESTSHFDERYINKKKKSRNAPYKSKIITAKYYFKPVILTTERKSGSEEDDLFQVGMNADWQWERNQARELYRRLQHEPSDWYFERANSRKHARKDAFTKRIL